MACRRVKAKQYLVRIVRNVDGSIEIDTGGKKAGRGAYLCAMQECWRIGLKGGRLERTLRATLTEDNREQLMEAAGKLGLSTVE